MFVTPLYAISMFAGAKICLSAGVPNEAPADSDSDQPLLIIPTFNCLSSCTNRNQAPFGLLPFATDSVLPHGGSGAEITGGALGMPPPPEPLAGAKALIRLVPLGEPHPEARS